MNKKRNKLALKLWTLSLLSSILLSIPFIFPHMGLVALVAFVPLFAAEYLAKEERVRFFFGIYYSAFLVWNLITTYWIWYATPGGAIGAFLLNSLQMAIIFALFRWMRGIAKGFLPYLFFIFTWLTWEHYYFTWDVSWPWLVLGNAFATSIKSVQWYEFTGSLGGSFWVLLTNALLFRLLLLFARRERAIASFVSLILVIVSPIIFSHILYYNYKEVENPSEFAVLQPNIDPYKEKFLGLTQDKQNEILMELMEESVGEVVDESCNVADSVGGSVGSSVGGANAAPKVTILGPETFIGWSRYAFIEGREQSNPYFRYFKNWVQHSNSSLILGAVTNKYYNSPLAPTETATEVTSGVWRDRFNTAMLINNSGEVEYYHKSKLVILAESNPLKNTNFAFVEKLLGSIAGGIGNFGTQPNRDVFTTSSNAKIGIAVCYESVYGEFCREYILNGANVLGIITNDGWWRDTPGHKQHLSYASLRAIETRRSIARSANTGISAFINQRGEIISELGWAERGYLNGTLNLNDKLTPFVLYGDIIGRVSSFIFALFLLMGISRKISKKYIVKEAC